MKTSYLDSGYASFREEALGDLLGKEGYAVCLGAGEDTVKLPTTAAEAAQCIGVIGERYNDTNGEIQVALFNKEGSFRGVAGGIITKGAPVAVAVGGKMETSTEALKAGRYVGQSDTADNDIIEILTK